MFSKRAPAICAFAALFFTLFSPLPALAGLPQRLLNDFAPVEGVVVMPVDGQFLIDLDTGKGVASGDLFSVTVQGKAIVHPVSGEVLGTLDKSKGTLEVTEVRSGYSYTRPLGETEGIQKGDPVRRFDGVPATFLDDTGQGEGIYSELKAALPHILWTGYEEVSTKAASPEGVEPVLFFILTQEGLRIEGPASKLLHKYSASSLSLPATASPAAVAPASAPQSQAEALWSGAPTEGLPVGVALGDFDGDGKQELARAFSNRLEIGRLIGSEWHSVDTLTWGPGLKVFRVDGADLNGNGRSEIYLSAVGGSALRSMAYEFSKGGYSQIAKDLSWFLRSVDLPEEGNLLLGQAMGNLQEDFAGPVVRMRWNEGNLTSGTPLQLPPNSPIYGFIPFQADGRNLVARINDDNLLEVVTHQGGVLWVSQDEVGGSEVAIERPDPSTNVGGGTRAESREVFITPDLHLDSEGKILVPVNRGFSILNKWKRYSGSQLKGYRWSGGSLREVGSTQEQDGYMSAFALGDANNDGKEDLLTLIALPTRNPFADRKSVIKLFPRL